MKCADLIKTIHVQVLNHDAYCRFSGILACGKVIISDAVPAAATNGWDVTYNPVFMQRTLRNVQEQRFVVLHEAMHKAFKHMHTYKQLFKEDRQLANYAADMVINLMLSDFDSSLPENKRFLAMPESGVQPDPKFRGWSVAQVYKYLKENPEEQPEGGDGGEGDGGDGQPRPGRGFDEHQAPPEGGEGDARAEERGKEIDRAVRQGEAEAKRRSAKGSGGGRGTFDALLRPAVDWREFVRHWLTETCAAKEESTWAKPNRRFVADDIYMPSMNGVTLRELVIGFDTSGSCFGNETMTQFVGHLMHVVGQLAPEIIHVVYWDTKVVGHQTFENGTFAVQNLNPTGGGGTDGAVLFDYLREKRIKPTAIVQFTDGAVGDWGRADCPVLWAINEKRITAPWGITVHID